MLFRSIRKAVKCCGHPYRNSDEDYEIYPEYYVNDPEGPKPVYQVTALGRGQSMNNVGRRPPLQCYGCGGPHKYSECPDRKPLQCFHCGEPHKVADCPYKPSTSATPVPNPHLPKATCSDCGITHLIPQCPHKPPEAPVIAPLNMMSRIILSKKPKPNPTLLDVGSYHLLHGWESRLRRLD